MDPPLAKWPQTAALASPCPLRLGDESMPQVAQSMAGEAFGPTAPHRPFEEAMGPTLRWLHQLGSRLGRARRPAETRATSLFPVRSDYIAISATG